LELEAISFRPERERERERERSLAFRFEKCFAGKFFCVAREIRDDPLLEIARRSIRGMDILGPFLNPDFLGI